MASFEKQYEEGFDAGRIATDELTNKIIKIIASVKGVGASTLAKIRTAIEASADNAEVSTRAT